MIGVEEGFVCGGSILATSVSAQNRQLHCTALGYGRPTHYISRRQPKSTDKTRNKSARGKARGVGFKVASLGIYSYSSPSPIHDLLPNSPAPTPKSASASPIHHPLKRPQSLTSNVSRILFVTASPSFISCVFSPGLPACTYSPA
jgi:hypothetical protein